MKVLKKKTQYQTGMKISQKIPYQYHAHMNFKKGRCNIQVPIGMFKRQYLPNTINKQVGKRLWDRGPFSDLRSRLEANRLRGGVKNLRHSISETFPYINIFANKMK
jgi:hypothetical protein